MAGGTTVLLRSADGHSLVTLITGWTQQNLGYSIWLFAVVLACFCVHLTSLARVLRQVEAPNSGMRDNVARLDQLTDVWIQLFVGIGVIWTAIGMRSALQAALGDGNPELAATADSVLRKLVDGGILLALSTTIVGGIGSYVMRLTKTTAVGSLLNAHYDQRRDERMSELILICQRLEDEVRAAVAPGPALRPVSTGQEGS